MEDYVPECMMCGAEYALARWAIGAKTCKSCGEQAARAVKRTIAPMHKSNYVMVTDLADLKGLNNKGGLVK
jgi:ribosomal protein L37AE/L43A